MNESLDNPNASRDEDWLEGLLRADAHEHDRQYLADDGFSARVMDAIPAPATLPAWRKPALAALWGIAAVGIFASLPGTLAGVGYDALHAVTAHRFTLQEIGLAVLSLASISWAGSLYALRQDR